MEALQSIIWTHLSTKQHTKLKLWLLTKRGDRQCSLFCCFAIVLGDVYSSPGERLLNPLENEKQKRICQGKKKKKHYNFQKNELFNTKRKRRFQKYFGTLTAFKCQKEYHYLAMVGYENSTSKKHLLLMTLHPPCLKPRQTSTQIVSLDLAVCKLNG